MDAVIVQQEPVKQFAVAENVIFVEFERAAFARLEYEISVEKACEVELAVGEALTADGRLDREPGGYRIFRTETLQLKAGVNRGFMQFKKHRSPYQDSYQRSKVITPENIGGEIEPFRCVEVSGQVKAIKLVRHAVFGEFDDQAADFVSSDDKLNKLWDFCKYTIKATSLFNIYVDGERERQAFEGDAYINALGAYCSGGSLKIARRTLEFMIEFYPIPCVEYRLITPSLVRDYFLYSGDMEIYKYWRDEMPAKLVPFFRDADGLFRYDKYNYGIFEKDHPCYEWHYQYKRLFPDNSQLLVDWPPWDRDNYEYNEMSFFPHNFLYEALNAMHMLEPTAGYDKQAALLRKDIYKYFYKDGLFVDSFGSSHTAVHTAATAMAFDLVDPADAARHVALCKEHDLACSVYMAQFLLDGLFKYGGAQYAIDLMRRDDNRSWLGMLKQGATITMEAWNNETKPNQDWNHAWGSAPGNVIPRRLAGIRPTSFGFKTFDVDPQPGDVESFKIKQPTPQGPVAMEYDQKHIKLQVPEGSQGYCQGRCYDAGCHEIDII